MTALHVVTSAWVDGDPDLEDHLAWGRDLRGLSPQTLRLRRGTLTRLVAVTGLPLRDMTEDALMSWERQVCAGLAPESRRAYVVQVRAFYRWALKCRVIREDPTGVLTLPKVPRALPRPLSEPDLRAAMATAPPKTAAIMALMAFAGLRCKEVAGLSWTDLRMEPQPHVLLRSTKGGDQRVVPVGRVILSALERHGKQRSGPMFYGRDGRYISPNAVSQVVRDHLVRCGIEGSAHQLRHRYGTQAYQATSDLRLVQEMLGHQSPTTTARYAAFDKAHAAEMVSKLDAAWSSEPEGDG